VLLVKKNKAEHAAAVKVRMAPRSHTMSTLYNSTPNRN
jgi:hypothetical protein